MQHLLKKADLAAGDLQELQGSLDQVLQQVDRCSEIIHNLLDFARKREPVVAGGGPQPHHRRHDPPGGKRGGTEPYPDRPTL